VVGSLAAALAGGPTPVAEAIRSCEEFLAEADRNGRANLLAPLAHLYAMNGSFDEAKRSIRACRAIFDELGQPVASETAAGEMEARILLLSGDHAQALEALERSYVVFRQHGDRSYVATRAARLAALLAQGEPEQARKLVDEARSSSTPDDVVTEWLCRIAEGRLLLQSGESERAERRAREAMTIMDGTDALNYRADSRIALAEVLTGAGRTTEAEATLHEAIELYERKGNLVAARRTRELVQTKSP
jgi:tetratricopeptide (TPR) repeat protein